MKSVACRSSIKADRRLPVLSPTILLASTTWAGPLKSGAASSSVCQTANRLYTAQQTHAMKMGASWGFTESITPLSNITNT
jgi:hypothetical protein